MRVAVVKAAHEDEAGVWYVEHSDVEGLHVEGETFEAFCRNVASAVADLVEGGEAQIEIIPHALMRAGVAAWGTSARRSDKSWTRRVARFIATVKATTISGSPSTGNDSRFRFRSNQDTANGILKDAGLAEAF
jgi:predicted RNase H-like HicB family nuclease